MSDNELQAEQRTKTNGEGGKAVPGRCARKPRHRGPLYMNDCAGQRSAVETKVAMQKCAKKSLLATVIVDSKRCNIGCCA